MIKEKQQPKFCINQEVRDYNGNSLSTVYVVLDVNWFAPKDKSSSEYCFRYTLKHSDAPSEIIFLREWELKSTDELCPYEVYGNKMVGKKVSHVDFTSDKLTIHFEDGYVSNFTADCNQNYGYLDFESYNN
jgi:hypothetical protein